MQRVVKEYISDIYVGPELLINVWVILDKFPNCDTL